MKGYFVVRAVTMEPRTWEKNGLKYESVQVTDGSRVLEMRVTVGANGGSPFSGGLVFGQTLVVQGELSWYERNGWITAQRVRSVKDQGEVPAVLAELAGAKA